MKFWRAGLAGLVAAAALDGNGFAQAKPVAPATPEAAAEWAKTLPPTARSHALHGVMAGWAESEPEAATRWAKNLGEREEWIVSSVVSVWSRKDPASASRYALEMPEGPQKTRALEHVGQVWGGKNRQEAMDWAGKLQAESNRKAAMGGVVQSWAMQDSEAALKFAEAESDAKFREQLLDKVVFGWCFKDRPGAEKWVKELPEGDLKKSMEEALARAPVIRRRVGGVCGTVGEEKVKVGQEAPLFATKTTDGKDLKLADFKGKFVLLDFWATWCDPDNAEQHLQQSINEYVCREAVLALANYYYQQTKWEDCFRTATRALSITEKKTDFLSEGWLGAIWQMTYVPSQLGDIVTGKQIGRAHV